MGQIQSSINQLSTGVIGGTIAKSLAGDSIKDNLGFKKNILSIDPEQIDAYNEAVGNIVGGDLKAQEAFETQAKIAKEQEQRNHMFNTVVAKYGTNAANKMDDAEIEDRYFELTDPKGYAKEQQAMDDGFNEYINEEISKYVAAGMDEDRAVTLVTTGVDIMDNPEAAIPNYNYDSAKGKQANNISLKQSITKKRLNKSFENRLANAKSRKVRQQSVGGKK